MARKRSRKDIPASADDYTFRMLAYGRQLAEVTYIRSSVQITLQAIPTPATGEADEFQGTVRNVRLRDYIIKAADLGDLRYPRAGDILRHSGQEWILRETPARELDPAGSLLQLQARYAGEAQIT